MSTPTRWRLVRDESASSETIETYKEEHLTTPSGLTVTACWKLRYNLTTERGQGFSDDCQATLCHAWAWDEDDNELPIPESDMQWLHQYGDERCEGWA